MNKQTPKDVESYIVNSPQEAHNILRELREIIVSVVPDAEEKISYNVPFYKYHGEFVGFAAYKKHVSFGFGADILQSQERDMLAEKGYTLGKGTLQIKFNQKVPTEEIKKILIDKAKMNEAQSSKSPNQSPI